MIFETVTLPEPPQEEHPIYAVLVYLTKKEFDFNGITKKCQSGSVNIYTKGTYLQKIDIDRFVSGAFDILYDEKYEAIKTAKNICKEKTDPDLRR